MLASLTTVGHRRLFSSVNTDSNKAHIRPTFDLAETSVCLTDRGICCRHPSSPELQSASVDRSRVDSSLRFPNPTDRRTDSLTGISADSNHSPLSGPAICSSVRNPEQLGRHVPGGTSAEETSLDEDDVGPLIQRRMELRRTLARLNHDLLNLLHEEWTLTGQIPDGYEDLLRQMGKKPQPIKTTSYPLPRLLIRRASTYTRPLLGGSELSTTSSLISGSVPWAVESTYASHPDDCAADSSLAVHTEDTASNCGQEHFRAANDLSHFPSTLAPVSLDSGCSDTELAYYQPRIMSSTQAEHTHSDQALLFSPQVDDKEVLPRPGTVDALQDPLDPYQGELSWTEDEEDIRRSAYQLQLRRLEVDYAVISQLHAVHKRRAMETKREAYRIAYKSNSRKLKEIASQMELIKAKLQSESHPQSPVSLRNPKSACPRRKTWNPLRIAAPPRWALSTLPRRQSRFDSPEVSVRHSVDAYSTPVTPDRRFVNSALGSPHKPPPSLASGSNSPSASRASSLASESPSTRSVHPPASTERFKRPMHPRPSLMPLFQFFRHSAKSTRSTSEDDDGLVKKPMPHPNTLPHPIVRSARLRSSLASGKRVTQKPKYTTELEHTNTCASVQHTPMTSTDQSMPKVLPDRSSLFFPHRQWRYTPQSTCSSFDEVDLHFASPLSSIRSSICGPANDVKRLSVCATHDNHSLETTATTTTSNFRQVRISPASEHTKLRRSLSNKERLSEDPLRDSAIDLPDLAFDLHHQQQRGPCPLHTHSVPDLSSAGSVRNLGCCRRGTRGCRTLERKRNWATMDRNSPGPESRPTQSYILEATKLSDLPGSSATFSKQRLADYARYSTSSFPPDHRLPCRVNAGAGVAILRPAASNTSSSNWSTSGCSCLSSHTGGSTALSDSAAPNRPTLVQPCPSFETDMNPRTSDQKCAPVPLAPTNTDPYSHSSDVPVVRLRNLEDRGRRFHEPTSNEGTDAYGSAIRVKCICSCLSEHTVQSGQFHASCTDDAVTTINSSSPVISPTPVGSLEGLDEVRVFCHRQCIHSTDSCDTTVAGSPVHTTSSSPTSSANDLHINYPVQKAKSKTCGHLQPHGIAGTLPRPDGLTKSGSNRRSIRPLALLRRAVSKVARSSTAEMTPKSTSGHITGPVILPSLISGRQVAMTETTPNVNGFHGTVEPRDGRCSSSEGSCVSLPGAAVPAGNSGSVKPRFIWSGKIRHSMRCPR